MFSRNIEKVKAINAKREQMPLAHVHSFGCQQNVSDGEKIKGMLAQMGYGFTPETAFADLILFNTCAVRENAEDRVFGNIGALKKLKEKNRNLIIAVGGCMVQQEHIAQENEKIVPAGRYYFRHSRYAYLTADDIRKAQREPQNAVYPRK